MPQFANVAFCPFNMGRDEERYPEALAFRPERWIPFTPLGGFGSAVRPWKGEEEAKKCCKDSQA